ncbi:hypothetical protein Tco_1301122 [Tanacetum coccineum]
MCVNERCQNQESRSVLAALDDLPESLSGIPPGDSFGTCFGDLRRHVPPVSCDKLLGAFRPSKLYSFDLLFLLPHMSSGSQNVGYAVVPKFDMHTYTSVLTTDEVKNLAEEYAIPLDLHPRAPPSGLTMNNLPTNKIAASMSQFLKFPLSGGVRVGKGPALEANEAIVQHTTQPLPIGTPIPKTTEYERVVEHEDKRVMAAKRKAPAAKDRAAGKRSAAEEASRKLKKKKTAPLSFALDESEGDDSTRCNAPKISGSGTHHSTSPLNTIVSKNVNPGAGEGGLVLEPANRSEDDVDCGLDKEEDGTEVNSPPVDHSLEPQPSNHSDNDEQDEQAHRHASGSSGHGLSSSSGGSVRRAFPKRNPGADGAGSSLRSDVALPDPFVPAWHLTTHSILNDAESCQDMMINLVTPAVRDQQSRLSDYQALQRSWFKLVSDRLTETQNQLVDVIQNRNKLADDHKSLQQEHLGCAGKEAGLVEQLAMAEKEKDDLLDKNREQEERIKQLEEKLASKTSSLTESENYVGTLKGDLERLTVDLSHAEIVRHNYVRQLLPTVFQRLLSNDEYKHNLSDVFNQAIATGWSEGVKVRRAKEDADAILAEPTDYDPNCKDTFMSAFESLFTKSYPYVEKLDASFRLPLGDLQNMWSEGEGATVGSSAANAQ